MKHYREEKPRTVLSSREMLELQAGYALDDSGVQGWRRPTGVYARVEITREAGC